ncbi:MAG: hypothetical protein JWM14_929 [Chitinophagaceae bacterium]|nr:hypothetical protein [Chitinophagaceae bacterium]
MAKLKYNKAMIYGFIELFTIFKLLKNSSLKPKNLRCQKAETYRFTN